jgi:hypothetical protein
VKSPAVQEYAQALWDARERGTLAEPADLIAGLGAAIAEDRAGPRRYDMAADQRVAWCFEIIRQRLERPRRRPAASGDLEAWTMWLLDREPRPAGRELAMSAG